VITRGEIQPAVEFVILICGDPAILTDVLSIGFSSNLSQYLFLEIAIGAVI
jgi:hypothetical protein